MSEKVVNFLWLKNPELPRLEQFIDISLSMQDTREIWPKTVHNALPDHAGFQTRPKNFYIFHNKIFVKPNWQIIIFPLL